MKKTPINLSFNGKLTLRPNVSTEHRNNLFSTDSYCVLDVRRPNKTNLRYKKPCRNPSCWRSRPETQLARGRWARRVFRCPTRGAGSSPARGGARGGSSQNCCKNWGSLWDHRTQTSSQVNTGRNNRSEHNQAAAISWVVFSSRPQNVRIPETISERS